MLLHPQRQLGQATAIQHNEKRNTMSKKTTVEEVKTTNNVVEPVNKDVKAKEAIETLRVQLKEHLQQAEYHRTMATKAQGALEVLEQLHPEENEEN
jgi:hypothetical protein